MRNRGWMGALVIGLSVASAAGCSAESPSQDNQQNPSKPIATARVKSSALTKKLTGAKAWRIYKGRTQVVTMGFDAKGAPIDGIRFRFASKKSAHAWAVSIESLKNGRVLQLDANGKVIAQTFEDKDAKILYGAMRVFRAWSAKSPAGKAAMKTFRVAGTEVAECAVAGSGAIMDCAPLVAQCARWGRAGAVGGGWGVAGAVATCLAWNWQGTARCVSSTVDAARTCYDAWNATSSNEEQKNRPPEQQEPPRTGEDAPRDPSSSPSGDPSSDPGGGDGPLVASADDPSSSDDASWDDASSANEESEMESEAAEEDPEAPLEEQVDESESSEDEYDANPSDPEEEAISEDSGEEWSDEEASAEEPSEEEASYGESSEDVESESFRVTLLPATSKAKPSARPSGACSASRVLQCGVRSTTAFCRCVR